MLFRGSLHHRRRRRGSTFARGLPAREAWHRFLAFALGRFARRGSSHLATDAAPAGLANNTKRNDCHQLSPSKHGRSPGVPLEVGHTSRLIFSPGEKRSQVEARPQSIDLFARAGGHVQSSPVQPDGETRVRREQTAECWETRRKSLIFLLVTRNSPAASRRGDVVGVESAMSSSLRAKRRLCLTPATGRPQHTFEGQATDSPIQCGRRRRFSTVRSKTGRIASSWKPPLRATLSALGGLQDTATILITTRRTGRLSVTPFGQQR
jgi:hypothetical protein